MHGVLMTISWPVDEGECNPVMAGLYTGAHRVIRPSFAVAEWSKVEERCESPDSECCRSISLVCLPCFKEASFSCLHERG